MGASPSPTMASSRKLHPGVKPCTINTLVAARKATMVTRLSVLHLLLILHVFTIESLVDRSFIVINDDYLGLLSQAVLYIYHIPLISERTLCPSLSMHAHGASTDREHHHHSSQRYASSGQ